MPAQVISFGIQKGGSSKTTTSGVTAYLLSRSHKVLTIDMDSQGNLTEFLARKDVEYFSGKTVLEAMQHRDVTDYIYQVTGNLHLVPADDLLATFSRWLYNDHVGNKALISQVADTYGELCFDTVLTRNAAAGRLPLVGFENNNELDRAVAQYEIFLKELLKRV